MVNPDQIRTVIGTFRDKLPEPFTGRSEVPKTLIFAKTDSHADVVLGVEERGGQPLLPPRGVDPGRIDAVQNELLRLRQSAIPAATGTAASASF